LISLKNILPDKTKKVNIKGASLSNNDTGVKCMEIENIYQELEQHLLQDEKPSLYLARLSELPLFEKYPYKMLSRLTKTPQSPKYHPEGNVWNHTMLVIDEAAAVKHKSRDPRVFMWAALLHDIGKPFTTKVRKGKITSYDHDKVGADMAKEFLEFLMAEPEVVMAVYWLVRYHMQILHVVNSRAGREAEQMKAHVDVAEVALLGWCDRMGRGRIDRQVEEENIQLFLRRVNR